MQQLAENPQFLTIKQFHAKHEAFTLGGLRSAIFWKGDELEKAGAIARLGRRVLINEPVFLQFVATGGLRAVRGGAA
jgi:CII-binding regulator of phage lambda lysogenization HflD